MKLVAVSMVKNEADIVEAFVRHTHSWVDLHLIFDDSSTDGSRQILAALVREGLPVVLHAAPENTGAGLLARTHLIAEAFTKHAADWVIPLQADEILTGLGRAELEHALSSGAAEHAPTLAISDYIPTTNDAAEALNPVVRIRHRQSGSSTSSRVLIPRSLGTRSSVTLEEGASTLIDDGEAIPSREIDGLRLGRFAWRSPQQQVLRVITGELQRLSRGRSHAGLDTHNRLGFQALGEDVESFFKSAVPSAQRHTLDPIPYLGGPLKYLQNASETTRSARALLPFLENLARSHGRLIDAAGAAVSAVSDATTIAVLDAASVPQSPTAGDAAFSGFTPLSGWQPEEGPVPSAFLPKFHWATAPETVLLVTSDSAGEAWLQADVLTYAQRQVTTVLLNGVELHRHVFTQVNQKDNLTLRLSLAAGENRLIFRHRAWLQSPTDPRRLALIFLSLRVRPV